MDSLSFVPITVSNRKELADVILRKLRQCEGMEMSNIANFLADMFIPIGYYGHGEISVAQSDQTHTQVWAVLK